MRIVNRTPYETAALRRLISAVHRIMAATEGRLRTWGQLQIEVVTRRARRYDTNSGRASLGGQWMVLRLMNPARPAGASRAHDLAALIEHELYHSYGLRHGRFRTATADWWAQHVGSHPLPLAPTRPRPRRDLVGERTVKARKMLVTWQRRLKLAQRKVRDYQRRVRYYERTAPRRASVRADSGANPPDVTSSSPSRSPS